jgi:hypothetical protein
MQNIHSMNVIRLNLCSRFVQLLYHVHFTTVGLLLIFYYNTTQYCILPAGFCSLTLYPSVSRFLLIRAFCTWLSVTFSHYYIVRAHLYLLIRHSFTLLLLTSFCARASHLFGFGNKISLQCSNDKNTDRLQPCGLPSLSLLMMMIVMRVGEETLI